MIIHIDMDAYYASIEIRDNPQLKNLPVVVGGSPKGRGVIAAASYEARKFGVHSAMSSAAAIRQCPQLIFISPRIDHYAAVSKKLHDLFERFTSLVEPLSLDEAFLDVSGSEKLFGSAEQIAMKIKECIAKELCLTASAGVAPNKYLAKLASDFGKPNGLVIVKSEQIQAFLDPLEIGRVWGVGQQTKKKFDRIGVRTVLHLRQLSLETLKSIFGMNGEHFWRLARGLDTREVVPDREAKSVSNETTFHVDTSDTDVLRAWMFELSDQVTRRMRRHEIKGRTVQIKIRYSDFETISRHRTLAEPSHSSKQLAEVALEMLAENQSSFRRGIRLLGMGVTNLVQRHDHQLTLFDELDREKEESVDSARDKIRERFGSDSLIRAARLQHRAEIRPQK